MIPPNFILQGRYRIIQQLGAGGMGAVYQAMDENLSCVVAVKETFATTEEHRRAFKREAELLANLNHPALPRVTDHFALEAGQFLVMQFISGNDLAELLTLRERPFSTDKVLEWADQLLDALEELHSYKPPIIHRDIKPANLKLTRKGRIVLLDFGLAKGIAGQMSTVEGDHSGLSVYGYTRQYAPLEQIRGAGTDPRSDLYSLGATLWTLLTGDIPPDALARIEEKEDGKPDPLRLADELNPKVPRPVAVVLHQAMAVNRNARPKSATEMRRALAEALEAGRQRAATYSEQVAEARTLRPPVPGSQPQASGPLELPPTSAAPRPATGTQERPSSSSGDYEHVQTMVAPRPDLPSWDGEAQTPSASFAVSLSGSQRSGSRKRLLIALSFVVALAGAVTIWLLSSRSDQGQPQPTNGQEQAAREGNYRTPPLGMVYVPGGEFTAGRDQGDEHERPAHKVTVSPFFIDQYEVTCEDYARFVRATARRAPPRWTGGNYPAGAARKPVTGVTWDDATDYAKWAGKRLPTEEEWEYAARGTDERLYPWGNEWQRASANADEASRALSDVGAFKGASPFGAYDMVGNAWEWTASALKAYPGGRLPAQLGGELRVIRGGSYVESKNEATTTYRRGYPARGNYDYGNTGFRCAKDVGGSSQ
jgi:formylglycine-generating enzyme required for sulfatase activity